MSDDGVVHVAMMPSAGMGHLTPLLRLAALLLQHHCKVTLITPHPTVSLSESQLLSRFLTAFPQVNQLNLHLQPSPHAPTSNSDDPFFIQFQAIRNSAHLLRPLLSSLSPPLSAFVSDVSLISSFLPITEALGLPSYIMYISCAYMFSFFSYFPTLAASLPALDDVVEIPGIPPIPRSSIPPQLLASNTIFRKLVMEDSPNVTRLNGVLINTFEAIEPQALEALNAGKVVRGMPPVLAVGPLVPGVFEKGDQRGALLKWLDDQPIGSVVYVGFGNRTALGRDQIREIGDGLMRSGCRFFWVVKDKIVDREDEVGLDEVLGVELVEKLKERGLVVKDWVDQSEILGHKAVGGFMSHCGWNSLMEAAWNGVPILAWPLGGDQRISASAVEMSGMGMWHKNWAWAWAGEGVVKGEEIGEAIKEMMKNESLKIKTAQLKEAGRKAMSAGGDCEVALKKLIEDWNKNVKNI